VVITVIKARCRWEAKKSILEIRCKGVGWAHVTQENSSVAVSFSRRTLLHGVTSFIFHLLGLYSKYLGILEHLGI